jgi:4-alpha-glucanotransferase
MQFPSFTHPVTGIAIPVGALKSAESSGVGEFLDLIPFAEFCKKAGLDLIQLLPVNDTGTESSPYSALSAFALHPIYIRLQALPEAASFGKDIETLRKRFEGLPRFDYRGVREAKLDLLHRIFDVSESSIVESGELAAWIGKNPWIAEYAVFMNLKRRNLDASWKAWDKMRTPTHAEIRERWDNPKKRSEHLFYAWVQMRLDGQLSEAVARCGKEGIALKGDIPIMMNEDSADAWANPEFFRDDLRAGSPPDGPNPLGQNWGFPIYNWDNLRDDGFAWWKARLAHSARYYGAYRIDHILGFFRIWSIPNGERTGWLGWTTPHEPITADELAELGFTGDRLRWICEPHVPTHIVEAANGGDYLAAHGTMGKLMNRIGNEELWLFKPEIKSEGDIRASDVGERVKNALAAAWRDRMMQITGRDDRGKALYAPIWNFRDTTAWRSLSDGERSSLERLIARKNLKNEELWKGQADEILGALTGSVDMLACAEDLGSVPTCVPEVLAKLGILGLKVIRWERRWNEAGQPFRDIAEYPEDSVATTSVHDSSTLRGWWEKEGGAADFFSTWGPDLAAIPEETRERFRASYGPEAAAFVLKTLAKASSRLFVPPAQDFLALSEEYRAADADDERVNVPGSVNAFNWTWRLPVPIEKLSKDKKIIEAIERALKERRSKPAKKGASR